MKTTLTFLLVIMIISCSVSSKKNDALIKEAEMDMKGAIVEADHWLADLNKYGYSLYFDQHFPPVFEKAIFESMDSIKKQEEIQKWISQVEQEFGKVKERELIGVHIITEGKLLTNEVHGRKGFKQISPGRLGLNNISQLYLKNIEGTYAYFMYESKPTKKDRAEELIVLWRDTNNKWNFITYKIADDI
ncbi:MAG: hypothetical protein ACM3PR_11345 [Bacteroidales bacterium]